MSEKSAFLYWIISEGELYQAGFLDLFQESKRIPDCQPVSLSNSLLKLHLSLSKTGWGSFTMAVRVVTCVWYTAWQALHGDAAFGSSITAFTTGDLKQEENKLRSVHEDSRSILSPTGTCGSAIHYRNY